MNILEEIYNGWKNYIFQSPEVEKIAKERIQICVKNECNKFRRNKTCSICGCYMPAKVRNLKSNCPLNKWNNII